MRFKNQKREEEKQHLKQKERTQQTENDSNYFMSDAEMDKTIEAFIRIAFIQYQKQFKTNLHGTGQQ